jgi:hypothetical protein
MGNVFHMTCRYDPDLLNDSLIIYDDYDTYKRDEVKKSIEKSSKKFKRINDIQLEILAQRKKVLNGNEKSVCVLCRQNAWKY